ncbi:hypothetical protein L6R52_15190 [Myxococcota bacterium]|nr:hypothetical protein [Myxococcota bacterium]
MVTMSSFASTLSRMVAVNAIESEETSRVITKAAHVNAEAEIEQKTAERTQANNLASAMSYVNMASSAVNVVKSGVKVGEAVDTAQQEQATRPQLDQNVQAVQADPSDENLSRLEDVRLGREGPRVGDRFNRDQLRVITGGSVNESREQLRAMGFSDREASQIISMREDGVTKEEATSFLWGNRKTEAQQNQEHVREKLLDALQSQSVAMLGQGIQHESKQSSKQGKRADELSNQLDEIGDKSADQISDHWKRLGEIELDGLRESKQSTTKRA